MRPIVEVEALCVQALAKRGKDRIPLIQDVSFQIHPGEMLALVGESGSGKSVTAGAVLGLLPNALHIGSGSLRFQGEDVLAWTEKKRRGLLGSQIGCVFQDYQGSFTPFRKIGKQLTEMIRTHHSLSKATAKDLALEWLDQVALPAERVYDSYPFQLSGGQRQRTALAAAMMLRPALVVADEPTTALDVLTGERVLDLLAELQMQVGCAVLLISHDLRHVMKRADTVAVMKDGRIVECEATEMIRRRASHPYTQTLLHARPLLTDLDAGLDWENEEVVSSERHEGVDGVESLADREPAV
ncbi:ABC transporter ATP-binding protein [Tumebacillus sp. DT12]|uniref:ABC transporter ATP-binding protein n=1 Tax=Tumebacillus lacus TaxID=2995335 RepID=A0ABT3X558_9BACL|nr:ABC transporter ATP-binding protein [Tumebacillus lacus]MCX7570982.1 ABC transporter ATP-binding protein [Tumebacillus lacus]